MLEVLPGDQEADLMLSFIGICLLMGVATEWLAWKLELWLYHIAWVRIFNIIVTFGLVYGLISYWLADAGLFWQFGVGAGLGLVNEFANHHFFRAWYFPGRSVPWLKDVTAVVVIGLAWGLVPPIAVFLRGLIA